MIKPDFEARPSEPLLSQSSTIVLGATSLVGRFLIDRLVGSGIETIAVSRRPHAPQAGVTWVTTNLAALDLPPDAQPRVAFSASPIWLLGPALPALHRVGVVRIVAFSSTSRYTKVKSPIGSEREVILRRRRHSLDDIASNRDLCRGARP